MALEGYTGPTSGRITVGGDSPAKVERFYDEPLTAKEAEAVAEFTALSPNEQLRRVTRMQDELGGLRMRLDVLRGDLEALREAVRRADRETAQARLKAAQRPPEGYSRPEIVRELMEHAERAGWAVAYAWADPDGDGDAIFTVHLRYGAGAWEIRLSWCCQPGGKGRRVRSGLIRQLEQNWRDAPSVVKLKEIITRAVSDG